MKALGWIGLGIGIALGAMYAAIIWLDEEPKAYDFNAVADPVWAGEDW